MKKYFLLILILLMPTGALATDWYACAGTKNINSVSGGTTSDVWYSEAACTGGSWYKWTSTFDDGLANGDNLYANGQANITINVDPGASDKTINIRNDAGGGTAGGTFLYATASSLTLHINVVNDHANTTLTISGSTGGYNITGNVTAGTGRGIYDAHTTTDCTIGGNVTGATEMGIYFGGSSGSVTVTGICTGGNTSSAYACYTNGGGTSHMHVGGCTSTATSVTTAYACAAISGSHIIVNGNIINSAYAGAVFGAIRWEPSDQTKYIKYDGGGTAIYSSWIPATNATAYVAGEDIPSTKKYVLSTDGSAADGTASPFSGGGAWGF